jgi:hypothetical protein
MSTIYGDQHRPLKELLAMAGKSEDANIASAAALYKKLVTTTEGYVGDAPIIHQAVALKAAIDAMDTAFAEDRDANF